MTQMKPPPENPGRFILDFVAEFGISKATAYRYVGPDGELRASAKRVQELQGRGGGKGA